MKRVSRRVFVQGAAAGLAAVGLPGLGAEVSPSVAAGLAAHDRAVHVFDWWIRDPQISLAKDGYFYLTGTTKAPGAPDVIAPQDRQWPTGWWVRVWRSRDLAKWESVGPVVSIKDTAQYKALGDFFAQTPEKEWHVWAPELHQREDGRWGLVFCFPPPLSPTAGGPVMLSKTPDVKGEWTNPMGAKPGVRHDPSLFRDDDGTWWMIWGNTAIAPLKPDWTDFAAAPVDVRPADSVAMGHEGSTIQKIEGKYVLIGTGWSTTLWRKGTYNLYYATAEKVTGPYGKRRLLGRFLGHGTPFQDKQGRWWCTAFPNANGPAVAAEGIETRDTSHGAQTINLEGLTLVPLEVRKVAGDVEIRALDPHYSTAGPDEAAHWTGKISID